MDEHAIETPSITGFDREEAMETRGAVVQKIYADISKGRYVSPQEVPGFFGLLVFEAKRDQWRVSEVMDAARQLLDKGAETNDVPKVRPLAPIQPRLPELVRQIGTENQANYFAERDATANPAAVEQIKNRITWSFNITRNEVPNALALFVLEAKQNNWKVADVERAIGETRATSDPKILLGVGVTK